MAATAEAMAYPRAKLVVASRVGNLPGPIDGPTLGTNHPIQREQTGITVMMGMTGKLCLAIDQTPVINEVISPTPLRRRLGHGLHGRLRSQRSRHP